MKHEIFLLALLLPACSFSHEPDNPISAGPDKPLLEGIEFHDDTSFQGQYPSTRCLRISAHGHTEAGLICRSRSTEFLIHNGIDPQDGGSTTETDRSVTVSTGVSLYEMQETTLREKTLYTADIDCDDANDVIYRPTSTCNVIYWPLTGGEFIYINITVENHASGQEILSPAEIEMIINEVVK